MTLAFAQTSSSLSSATSSLPNYPPPRFVGQTPATSGCAMSVEFDGNSSLVIGATKDPGLPLNGSSAICPSSVPEANCSVKTSRIHSLLVFNLCRRWTTAVNATHWDEEMWLKTDTSSFGRGAQAFELLCATPAAGAPGHYTAHQWVRATATLAADGQTLTLTAPKTAEGVARGSRYAWGAWPLATLFEKRSQGGGVGLPILPWNQALTM